MRAAFWLMTLFAIAAATALFAGNNQAVLSIFWPPHRIDVSFNLAAFLMLGLFVLIYVAMRALSAVVSLPLQARAWRAQQKERAMYGALMDALAHQLAGRYIRATKSAQNALTQEKSLARMASDSNLVVGYSPARASQLQSLANLLAAESAQALQNKPLRDEHLHMALQSSAPRHAQEVREGVQFRAARWALDDRDAAAALDALTQLPQGAGRRTLALRMKLRATRQLRQTREALETARLLAKHRAFSPAAAQSLVRGLGLELLGDAHDPAQLKEAWALLDANERVMPELAVHAAARMMSLHGDAEVARTWLLLVWPQLVHTNSVHSDGLRISLVKALEPGLDSMDASWLERIEAAQTARPRDANLQYLAGMACLSRQLWGKAKQWLGLSVLSLQDVGLNRKAWLALAQLAEQRDDAAAAAEAYKRAAQL